MIHRRSLATADLRASGLRRDFITDPAGEDALYVEAYDRTTLWYDSFWRDGRVMLICPKLLNFTSLIRSAQFFLDGRPVKRARLLRHLRHDVIELRSSYCPAEVSVTGNGLDLATRVNTTELDRFAAMNTHFTVSRDNHPDWIRDFALYHRKNHGLQAMVLFDNGSTSYPLTVIEDALQDAGLSDYLIVSAPPSFGRTGSGRLKHEAKFLHTALMNVARLRFLWHARAVLNADIDELVWTVGETVFDKAVNSRLGYVSFAGEWRYPRQVLTRHALHSEHDQISPEDKPCPAKYCIVPRGPLGRLSWDVHNIGPSPLKKLFRRSDIGFLHCRRITTDWKNTSRMTLPGVLRLDPHTRVVLDNGFSDQESEP